MEIELQTTIKVEVKYLEVSAAVRYLDDAIVNGVRDYEGKIPLRVGDNWEPTIQLFTGKVLNWPSGTTAKVYYKVCDAGLYWLLDDSGKRVAKYKSSYVPDLLSVGNDGYGDYIILKIDGTGQIEGWEQPTIDTEKWEAA